MRILLGLVVLVLDVMAVLDVFNTPKDPEKKLLWSVIILLLPLVGPLAYFLLARHAPPLGPRRTFP